MVRAQKKIWEEEHKKVLAFPSYEIEEPSSSVVEFLDFLEQQKINHKNARVIDIGCGKGRNAIYLAQKGFTVYAIDYVKEAIEFAQKFAEKSGVSKKINFAVAPIDEKWLFEDNFFDFAVDCFSSIDIETYDGRVIYRNELRRTLKPGGYALVAVVSADDEFEEEMIKRSPGPEKNSTLWPETGKFQKDYNKEELREFYKDFRIIDLKEVKKQAFKLNRNFIATNYWLVLQKQ